MNLRIISFLAMFVITTAGISMPNPSITYCVSHGGKLSERGADIGIGICSFADGTECGAWDYKGGKCKPGIFTDWIDKNVSKKTELKFSLATSGYISNSKPPAFIPYPNRSDILKFSEEENARFYYMRLIVLSRNQNAKQAESHPAQILLKKDNVLQKRYPVMPIRNGGNSKPIDIFIAMKDKGFYQAVLLPTGGDVVQGGVAYYDFNNAAKNKISHKMTPEQIRAMRLAEWLKAHPKKK